MPIKVYDGSQWVQVSDGTNGTNGTDGGLTNYNIETKTGAFSLASADAGKLLNCTNAGNITVPHGVFGVGDVITIRTDAERTIISGTNTTVKFAGSLLSGDRTLADNGLCSIICITDSTIDVFVISGSGLT